ncbi:1-acyl-sn-glycerol-3-phosphate acyltransferase [Candidatus Sumerlaeota bacterium]|nr:1-acyl-sn-glycerol-3-phosphate acyltransferase [Candidatus Sumerlaeota bacterium]
MLQRFADLVVRTAVRTFYRRVELVGHDKIPPQGPTLLVANHFNSLVDPLVIQAALSRWVTFAATDQLFHGTLGFFMKQLGMIPIYRAMDRHDPQMNYRSFRRAYEVLGGGGVVALFPEGITHDEPHVQRLKSGAARIFFGAMEHFEGRLDIRVIPIGLVYEDKHRFQGRVAVVVGNPVDTAEWIEIAREEPQRAARLMTNHLQGILEDLSLSLETWEDQRLVNGAVKFYLGAREELGGEPTHEVTPDEEMEIHQAFRAEFLQLRRKGSRDLDRLRRLLTGYQTTLGRLGITDQHVRDDYPPQRVIRYLLRNTELVLLGWPLAAYGIANNILGVALVRLTANRIFRPRRDRISTIKIFYGTIIFLVTSLLQTGAVTWLCVARGWPWWIGLIYLVSLPLSGWYATSFFHRRRRAIQGARAFALLAGGKRRIRDRLRAQRARIIETLRSLMDRPLTSGATDEK